VAGRATTNIGGPGREATDGHAAGSGTTRQRRLKMKRTLIGGVMVFGLLLVFGCNPKVGIISLNTIHKGRPSI
jgi:hypothetical protein